MCLVDVGRVSVSSLGAHCDRHTASGAFQVDTILAATGSLIALFVSASHFDLWLINYLP